MPQTDNGDPHGGWVVEIERGKGEAEIIKVGKIYTGKNTYDLENVIMQGSLMRLASN